MADVDCIWISIITVLFVIITMLSFVLIVVCKRRIPCCNYEILFRNTESNTNETMTYSQLLNRDEDRYRATPELPPRLPTSRLQREDSPRSPRGVHPIMGRRLLMAVPPPPSPEVAMKNILMSISPPPTPPRVSAKKTKMVLGRPPLPPPPPPPAPTSLSFRNELDNDDNDELKDYGAMCEEFNIPKMTYISSESNESLEVHPNTTSSSFKLSSLDSLEDF